MWRRLPRWLLPGWLALGALLLLVSIAALPGAPQRLGSCLLSPLHATSALAADDEQSGGDADSDKAGAEEGSGSDQDASAGEDAGAADDKADKTGDADKDKKGSTKQDKPSRQPKPKKDKKGKGKKDKDAAKDKDKDGSGAGDMFVDIDSFDDAAADKDGAGDPAQDGKGDQDAAGDSADDTAGDDSNGEIDTKKIRRPRPQTAEQERTWKLNKTRGDPYLNPPSGELDGGKKPLPPNYDPSSFLSRPLPLDFSVYLTQDAKGKLLGSTSFAVEQRKGEHGEAEVLLTRVTDWGDNSRTEVLFTTDGLKPQLIKRGPVKPVPLDEQLEGDAAEPPVSSAPMLRVEYYYDRVTIRRDAGAVASVERMRALPHAFDVQQLPLLLRMLDYSGKSWPFEAYITEPEKRSSSALAVEAADLQNQLSAEGENVACDHVRCKLGETQWEWWVQRKAPYRLIRFSDGTYTYTLSEYSAAPRGGY